MKNLITILILFSFGCGKTENATEADTKSNVEKLEAENKRMKAEIENKKLKSDTAAENKKLKEEDVIGTYEAKRGNFTFRLVLLENGTSERYLDEEKENGEPWKLVENEVHLWEMPSSPSVYKIEPNGDLTYIAYIEDGKRKDREKNNELTWAKLK